MAEFTIVLGNKNYSSWSLRPWLVLKRTGAPFDEIVIPLSTAETGSRIRVHSPSGRVPVLKHNDFVVWESLAIGEYLAELFPAARLWPADRRARAHARAISHEIHAGFAALRTHMPMNVRASFPGKGMTPEVKADIDRIVALWTEARARFGTSGELLFGHFTIADAMYAPVVTRFRTYGVALPATAQAYADAVWALPEMQVWVAAAKAEKEAIAKYDSWP
jgi:glutathione S-transferase